MNFGNMQMIPSKAYQDWLSKRMTRLFIIRDSCVNSPGNQGSFNILTKELVAWKKCVRFYYGSIETQKCLVQLTIPVGTVIYVDHFKTTGQMTKDQYDIDVLKCRAQRAKVNHITCLTTGESFTTAYSMYDNGFMYAVDEVVESEKPFNATRTNSCESGIHFFLTKEEAKIFKFN